MILLGLSADGPSPTAAAAAVAHCSSGGPPPMAPGPTACEHAAITGLASIVCRVCGQYGRLQDGHGSSAVTGKC